MAECLEDLSGFNYHNNDGIKNLNEYGNSFAIQLIELAEREKFNELLLVDVTFPDGIAFNRLERLVNLKRLKIENTNISILKNLPKSIVDLCIIKGEIEYCDAFYFSPDINKLIIINNGLEKFSNLQILSNLVYIDFSQNNLTSIPPLPENVLTFIATHNNIKTISNLNPKLKELNLSNNKIDVAINIPNGIEKLSLNRNNLKLIDLSPFKNLKIFKAFNNQLELIVGPVSESIEIFDVFNNKLQAIPYLGKNIKEIDIADNDFKLLPYFDGDKIERLDITKNPLLKLDPHQIKVLLDLEKTTNIIYDQFEVEQRESYVFADSDSDKSTESELDMTGLFDSDSVDDDIQSSKTIVPSETRNRVVVSDTLHEMDILEMLQRQRIKNGFNFTQYSRSNLNQPNINQDKVLIKGKPIHHRRIYEM